MEHISRLQRKSHQCGDSIIHEYPTAVTTVGIEVIDVGERHPIEGFIENGEGIAILQIIRKYGRIVNPDSEKPETRVGADDQVTIMPNERFALEGPMNVVLITSPSMPHDQEKHVG